MDIDEIEFLRNLRFSWTRIASILGVSRSTLYRKLNDEGISQDLYYSDISDLDLDRQIQIIKRDHPNDGERLIIGHLLSRRIIVQRSRIRASIHRIDPVNTAIRRSITVKRCVYHAEGPNAIWHIDGHHKLIRWRLVTHGGIDGFSRTITYLQCSENNCAATVLSAFVTAAELHGLPLKVRSDMGGENTEVWRYMIEQHSSDSVIITGSSTHNERIERLWRDVHRCVTGLFYTKFNELEDEGCLNSLNEIDIYCLHFVYIPRINSALKAFVESWNNHPISTERNYTPNQLFVEGALHQDQYPIAPPSSHSLNVPEEGETVIIPRIGFNPCLQLQQELNTIDPLRPTADFGGDIFMHVVQCVGVHLQAHCNHCTF